MASRQIQGGQIVRLAAKIHVATMEKIAVAKFNLEDATIANIITQNQGDVQKQSQEMITNWKYRLGTDVNQVEVRNGLINTHSSFYDFCSKSC